MNVVRKSTIGPVTIKLEARDRYNDYSVIFDHEIAVDYGNGRAARFDVGTDVCFAVAKYDAAVTLALHHSAKEAT